LPFRYAWAAHPGGHWAAVVASGIPFGLGAFVLFVGVLSSGLCLYDNQTFLTSSFRLKLSSIIYLVETYGAEAAASGKFSSFSNL
jgi:hypothetical protein